ncbi:MAG TPA: hypothetical protein PKY19_07515 [Oscillospiraceae bacterium]|nr:hypothetical protein [Oscillospiraceae bacterium]HXK78309.1 hypothetical protein [Oscillospiraceae bacterium]
MNEQDGKQGGRKKFWASLKVKESLQYMAIMAAGLWGAPLFGGWMGEVDREVYLVYLLLISGLPMLAAVTGYVMGDRDGICPPVYPAIFLLSYGSTAVFFSLYAAAWKTALIYTALAAAGSFFGWLRRQRRIRDILAGKKEEHKTPLLLKLFDRYDIKKYK